MKTVAINGFGRIGRLFFRQAIKAKDIQVVAINDLGDIENLAYLLRYDSVYGKLAANVEVVEKTADGGVLVCEGKRIAFSQVKDSSALPWKKMSIDIVVEATGVFESYEKAQVHLKAGARRVVITAPAKDEDRDEFKTILMGVNEEHLKTCLISSNGSCTTNAAAPVVQILSENPGILKASLNTVHGYTATQNLVDGPTRGKDFRRGRAGAFNIVPSSTGAAISVIRAIPQLAGKFDGIALRVPTLTGSIADITFLAKRKTSPEEINDTLTQASQEPRWQGILKVTNDPLVSSDIVGEPYGAIVDLESTRVVGGDLVKVLSWYDNEWGYVATLVKHVQQMAATI
ncbi:MAG: type I glyceraldehyde-3-phosphate dehydrogenase [Parcubacteria group bacterium]|nr:type I glyceraldehyde-3-phosphate dehydrogenase [Parcubacteria group bacterium]